jgi:hypothetical protein
MRKETFQARVEEIIGPLPYKKPTQGPQPDPIVRVLKKKVYPCDWCPEACRKPKWYRRYWDSQGEWVATCRDCGKTRELPLSQLINNK